MNLYEKLLRKGESPKDASARTRLGTIGAGTGVGVNVLLSAMKLIIGAVTGSVAITADAANNLSDAGGSIMSLISMRMANKPVDKEHPFGHGRIEYLGALGVGVLILMMGFELLKSGAMSILHPETPAFGWLPFFILTVSIALKLLLYYFYNGIGGLIEASSLLAAAKDSLSDVWATTAVAAAMIISQFTTFPVDGVMGVLVSLLVLKAGFGVVKEMIDTLIGGNTNPELGREIIQLLLKYEDILGTHDLLIHDYGPGRCIASVHAEVPADGDILHLHEVIDLAEREIGEKLGISICIHMDPIVTGDAATDEAHGRLNEALRNFGDGLMLHDLRMVPGENRTNLVFDVAVPAGYTGQAVLTQVLCDAAKAIDPRYECVIHFDIDYYHAYQEEK